MDNKGEQLKKRRQELRMSVTKLAEMLDIPKDRVYKWEKGANPSTLEDHQKIDTFLSNNLEGAENGFNNISRQNNQNKNNSSPSLQDLIESNRLLIEIQLNYSQAQKQLADAQKILAESHKSVVDNNTTLTAMLKNFRAEATASADPEIQEAVLVKLDGLQQLLIEVGVGKLWKTKADGEDRLHREFSSLSQKNGKGRKTAGGGIAHR